MAEIGHYGTGSIYSTEYSTVSELLNQLPDNTAHLIYASDVRDSVYTLWNRVAVMFASFSASFSVHYTNTNPTLITVGGIAKGSTFNNKTMQEMWDYLLHPYILPSCSIIALPAKELGSPRNVSLVWSAVKGSNLIDGIQVGGSSTITPTGYDQSGTQPDLSTQNSDYTFNMTVTSGTASILTTTNQHWQNGVYWGRVSSISSAPSMIFAGTKPAWADGAGVGPGKKLADSFADTYNLIDGAGQYITFAWPTYNIMDVTTIGFTGSGVGGEPKFTVNGLVSTAWTKIGNSVPYSNSYGYGSFYDVWVSNTAQNAPISTFIIS